MVQQTAAVLLAEVPELGESEAQRLAEALLAHHTMANAMTHFDNAE